MKTTYEKFNEECEKQCFSFHEGYHKFKDRPQDWGEEETDCFDILRKLIDNTKEDELIGHCYTTSLGDKIEVNVTGGITINGI